jgi:hypothetical protein
VVQCDELGVAWSQPEACGDEQTCVDGACFDNVCEPNESRCDGEVLLLCNEHGTQQHRTDCTEGEDLCDADARSCVPRLCDPDSRVCNGDRVFQCSGRGDAYAEIETCGQGERCRGGACLTTCTPGEARCEENTLYVCLNDGVNEDARACGEDALCLDGACTPVVCEGGQPGCRGSIVTLCNDNGTGFDDTDVDCADNDETCAQGRCVRINECPTTIVVGSSEGAGVGPRSGEIVVPASAGLLLDGNGSTDDVAVARVDWQQVEGPEGASIGPGQSPLTGNVTGLDENERYVFQGVAVDDEGLVSCDAATLEVFTVGDERLVIHLTWHDEGDNDENDNRGADADLHMLKAQEGLWATPPYAVYYDDRSPNWRPERPEHLGDDTNGRGPETITLDNPQDCEWYAVGASFFRSPFRSPITLGWNVFIDGGLAHSSYTRELEERQFVEELLIHWETGEIFSQGRTLEAVPTGQRPGFSEDAIDSGLCGLPDDVVPPSCEDDLGDISRPAAAAAFGTYTDLSVCAGEPDYFGEATGTGNVLMVRITTNSEELRTALVDEDDRNVAPLAGEGVLRASLPGEGPYYLRVSTGGGPDAYGVRAVVCDEDELAPNQAQDDSYGLEDGTLPDLTVCGAGGADWFHVDLEVGDSALVTTQTRQGDPVVALALYDPDDNLLAEQTGQETLKVVDTGQVSVAGEYRIRVSITGVMDVVSYELSTDISRALIGIDLAPTIVSASPAQLIRGSRLDVSATVANLGARGATFSTAQVYLQSAFERIDLDTVDQNPYPAQSVRTEVISTEVPEDIDPGEYSLCFQADSDGDIPEVNEDNNVLCEAVEVLDCLDPYEPNADGEQAVVSGADWFDAEERGYGMDLCPFQDVDVYYADVDEGDHQFCVETQNGAWVNFRLYDGDARVSRNGPSPCIEREADSDTRYYFSIFHIGLQTRVQYRVTYSSD